MLLWLWGPEGGDKRALREWLELQIPPNSLPRVRRDVQGGRSQWPASFGRSNASAVLTEAADVGLRFGG